MIRIIVDKVRNLDDEGTVVESVRYYTTSLEDGKVIVAEARQPFVAATRALLEREAYPDTVNGVSGGPLDSQPKCDTGDVRDRHGNEIQPPQP